GCPGVVSWHPGGDLLASASADGSVRLWDVRSGRSAGEMKGHVGPVTAMTISPDGRFSATGGHDGSIVLWDLRQRSSIRELSSDRVPIIRLDWDVDGRHVFVAREDGVLLLVDVSNGRIARRIAVEGDKLCAANLSADGGSCLVGLRDGSVQLYDLRSRELIRRFSGPSSKLVAVALSYDDRRAAAIGGDGTVRIWQLDWMPRFREFADWDERARPILEACATVHDAKAEKARGADIGERPLAETVKTKLTNRGLGWIRLEGILEVLGKRARQPEQVEDTQLLTMRTQQKSMIANPLKRQRAIRGARIAAVVLLLLLPLVWLTSHRKTLKQVRFDSDKVRETRMMRAQAIAGSPAGLFSQEVECQQELIDHYIGLYIRRHGRPEQIAKARICLEILADAKVVEPALGLLRVSEEETADSAGSDSSQDLDYV
ncbi:MAG: hypothetical protein GY906_06605, partial [bacterium]|nr:hypothetical protein [bacterium]